jgi:hypothetical protein
MKRLIVPIFILIIVMGCKEVFVAPPQALLLATFYRSSTNLAVSPEITAQGFGRDSFLVYRQTGSSMLFPLTFKDTTQYVLSMDTISKPDSITFIHQSTKKYASVETGFYYEYKLLSVNFTHHRIDSLKIIDSLVTTKWHENIKLYLHSLPVVGQ